MPIPDIQSIVQSMGSV